MINRIPPDEIDDDPREVNFTSALGQGLDEYLDARARANQMQDHFMTDSSQQWLGHLAKKEAFYDLIRRLDSSVVLALEVKIRVKEKGVHKFPSFKEKQLNIYRALAAAGAEGYYCYNAIDEVYNDIKPRWERVALTKYVELPDVTGTFEKVDDHGDLNDLIDALLDRDGAPHDGAVSLFFSAIFGRNSSRIGVRRMLIAYNFEDKELFCLDHRTLDELRRVAHSHLRAPFPDLEKIDHTNHQQMVHAFKAYAKRYQEIVEPILKRVREENLVWTPPVEDDPPEPILAPKHDQEPDDDTPGWNAAADTDTPIYPVKPKGPSFKM